MNLFTLWGQNLPSFLSGTVVTVQLTGYSLVLAVAFAFLLALGRLSRWKLLSASAGVYIEVVRAIPVLVLLFVAYYSLGQIGFKLSGFWAAVFTLAAFYATLYAEIFRGGILGVEVGQREAALALGMGQGRIMRRVILPQAFASILPPSINQLSNIIKDTSLVVTVGVADLMYEANQASASTFLPMDMLALAAVLYFAFYILVSRVLARWEVRVVQRSRR